MRWFRSLPVGFLFCTLLAAVLCLSAITAASPVVRGPRPEAMARPPQTAPPRVANRVLTDATIQDLKREASDEVEKMRTFTQQMVDTIFSFGELGFQEIETSRYLVEILRNNGFTVEEGIAGIPTAWMATWGSGAPVIALGSDIDGIPQASQKPGVSYREPIVEGAPGHGEGHNSGQALNITAALAVKKIMEREQLSGTIKLWPGVAEELLATKAYYVRDGYFNGIDAVIFSHVASTLNVSWGSSLQSGLVSVEYRFQGESAHSAGAPWRGRSALDAVELMNIGWNYRREHLRYQQRSHYVITDGGDQPNVVPSTASVWYYFRETEYPLVKRMWQVGDNMAKAAALMTDTTMTTRVLGSAWPGHFNKPIAEAMYENIRRVGLPEWTEADQTLAKAVQRELKVAERGLLAAIEPVILPVAEERKVGGGSDDIGDISWNVPTVTLQYPANIPNLPGHNWTSAISMATPIAHKGTTAGAKVEAMTLVDLVTRPELIRRAKDYFTLVQTKETKYQAFISAQDVPAVWLNKDVMDRYRPEMKKFYYDPTRYKTYLEQLGIEYPTIRKAGSQ